jgi:putative membrane protein
MKKIALFLLGLFISILGPQMAMAQTNDGETLGIVSVIDQNEIQAAQEADKKKINSDVRDYAQMLLKAHTDHLDEVTKLAQKQSVSITSDSAIINDLRTKGAQDLTTLNPLDGEGFAKSYIELMIKGHTEALKILDERINSSSGDVKSFLQETRMDIADHLKKAQDLQNKEMP